jgi:hypothetical protein
MSDRNGRASFWAQKFNLPILQSAGFEHIRFELPNIRMF